jgi:phosphohistidine phosphatase
VKRLFLLRHAKSSWDDPGLDDHERPLAPRGRRASKLIGEHLRRERIEPSLVLCSSARRTRETLERVMPAPGGTDVSVEDGLYTASSGGLLQRLREVPPDVESVMLVGHQPAIQELALDLAGDGLDLPRLRAKFPTAALATLLFAGDWSELGPGRAELVAYVKPKELTSEP